MKLQEINKGHIHHAALQIDEEGIPKDNVWSQFYVVVNGKEYPFKNLVRIAYSLITKEKLVFQSNDSYRNYIKSIGFEIKYHKEGYNFFTRDELEYYSSVVGKPYRVNSENKEQEYFAQKLSPIIAKVHYWAEQLLVDGFKLRTNRGWLTAYNSHIKPYFWPRIYSGEDKDIFFNVEVNGEEGFIGYKLDGYFETKKELPEYKKEILKEYKTKINWEWPRISFKEIEHYGWERLIDESKRYVQKYLKHHDELKRILSIDHKIARITWNTNMWVKPSGKEGKSENPSFENEHGYGHEEWLFDNHKKKDGFKYGFLEPIHKYREKYEGKMMDITLYTRENSTGSYYWVTTLKDVSVITKEESKQVLNYYKEKGWFAEMKVDLDSLNLDSQQLDIWADEDASNLFNVKFDEEQLSLIATPLIALDGLADIPSGRYTLMDVPSEFHSEIDNTVKTGFSFEDSGNDNADLLSKGKRKGNPREIELVYKHNDLQTAFLAFLQRSYGKPNVKIECSAHGGSRIDVVRKTDTGFIFYEIKTYNSLRSSLREALGQLLEYSLFPNVNEAEKLVLVSDVMPSDEMKQYIWHVGKFIKIPLFYICFDMESNKIILEI